MGRARMMLLFLAVTVVVAASPAAAGEPEIGDDSAVSGSETVVTLPAQVEIDTATDAVGNPVEVRGAVEDPGSSSLPFTGGDVATTAIVGLMAVALGAVVVSRTRARSRLRSA